MSRPIKKGLSYFPLDTDILSDRKIRRLFQNYGCEGFSTYMAILCEAYGTTGYYVRYTDDFCFDIGFTLNLKEEQIREIIGFCVEIRLFNQELFALQGIPIYCPIEKYVAYFKIMDAKVSPPTWRSCVKRMEPRAITSDTRTISVLISDLRSI